MFVFSLPIFLKQFHSKSNIFSALVFHEELDTHVQAQILNFSFTPSLFGGLRSDSEALLYTEGFVWKNFFF